MGFEALKNGDEAARGRLASGEPLAIRFDEAVPGGDSAIKGFLIVDAFGTKAGTRVTVAQAGGLELRRGGLAEAIAGSDKAPPLVKGEVVAFASAFVQDGVARAGEITARSHEGLLGEVQVFTAMVRPSQSRVSKKGASQSLVVSDGKAATVARSFADIEAAFAAAKSRKWPGGSAGLLFRDKGGGCGEFFEEKDSGIDYLIEKLEDNGVLAGPQAAMEIIPAWRLPMGRNQVTRDVNPKIETKGAVSGRFTAGFETGKPLRVGFLPCLVVACDEEEWAFGGKTGRILRVASAVQPLFRRQPVLADRLPTAVRPYGGMPNTVLALYDDETAARMAATRAAKAGMAKPEERDAGTSRPPAPGFAMGRGR